MRGVPHMGVPARAPSPHPTHPKISTRLLHPIANAVRPRVGSIFGTHTISDARFFCHTSFEAPSPRSQTDNANKKDSDIMPNDNHNNTNDTTVKNVLEATPTYDGDAPLTEEQNAALDEDSDEDDEENLTFA